MSSWAVVFGGPSPEHEISILTGLQAERVLTGAGDSVTPIYWAPSGEWFLVPGATEAADYLNGVPKGAKPIEVRISHDSGLYVKRKALQFEAALLTLHGGVGEGGGAASVFSLLGIPATGSSLFAAAVGMDKLAFGGLMLASGVPSSGSWLGDPLHQRDDHAGRDCCDERQVCRIIDAISIRSVAPGQQRVT